MFTVLLLFIGFVLLPVTVPVLGALIGLVRIVLLIGMIALGLSFLFHWLTWAVAVPFGLLFWFLVEYHVARQS